MAPKVFKCEICQKILASDRSLKNHSRNIHQNGGGNELIRLDPRPTNKDAPFKTGASDNDNKNSDIIDPVKVKPKFAPPLKRVHALAFPVSESPAKTNGPPPGPTLPKKVKEGLQSDIQNVQQRIHRMAQIVEVDKILAPPGQGKSPEPANSFKLQQPAVGIKKKQKEKSKKESKIKGAVKENPKANKFDYFKGFSMSTVQLEPLKIDWNKKKTRNVASILRPQCGDSSNTQQMSASFAKPERPTKKYPVAEISETCKSALAKLRLQAKEGEDLEDSAPPSEEQDTEKLHKLLLDEGLPLFDRYRAMYSLRNKGDDVSVKALASGLTCSSAFLRHDVALVLGQVASPCAVEELVDRLRDIQENHMVRHDCAEALGGIASPGVEVETELAKYLSIDIPANSIASAGSTIQAGAGVQESKMKELKVATRMTSAEQAVPMRTGEKTNNLQLAPSLRKKMKRKSRLKCDEPNCIPCTIVDNCQACHNCLIRPRSRQKCMLRQCPNLNSRIAKKPLMYPAVFDESVLINVSVEENGQDEGEVGGVGESRILTKESESADQESINFMSLDDDPFFDDPFKEVQQLVEDIVNNVLVICEADALYLPMKYEPKPKIYPCRHCDKTFAQFKSAQTHIKLCTGPKKPCVVCEVCKKSLADKRSLKRHMIIHSKVPFKESYKCDVCDVTFTTKHKMKAHNILKHELPAPGFGEHKCPVVGCGFVHAKEAFVKAHITRYHCTRDKIHCSICQFQCNHRSGMAKHMLNVHCVSSDDPMVFSDTPELPESDTSVVNLDLNEIDDILQQVLPNGVDRDAVGGGVLQGEGGGGVGALLLADHRGLPAPLAGRVQQAVHHQGLHQADPGRQSPHPQSALFSPPTVCHQPQPCQSGGEETVHGGLPGRRVHLPGGALPEGDQWPGGQIDGVDGNPKLHDQQEDIHQLLDIYGMICDLDINNSNIGEKEIEFKDM